MKESEASKASKASEASKASKPSQAIYASIASPQILYYLKSASGAAKSDPRRPGELIGDPPQIWGAPPKKTYFTPPKISFWGSEKRPEAPRGPFRGPPSNFWELRK